MRISDAHRHWAATRCCACARRRRPRQPARRRWADRPPTRHGAGSTGRRRPPLGGTRRAPTHPDRSYSGRHLAGAAAAPRRGRASGRLATARRRANRTSPSHSGVAAVPRPPAVAAAAAVSGLDCGGQIAVAVVHSPDVAAQQQYTFAGLQRTFAPCRRTRCDQQRHPPSGRVWFCGGDTSTRVRSNGHASDISTLPALPLLFYQTTLNYSTLPIYD